MTLAGLVPPDRDAGRFPALFEPGRVSSLRLKNWVLMAPMEKNLCSADGARRGRPDLG
jgi:2,4-dienoyl-CoA reductase-like NADH-dependent reductase (Old Yellow Enzyme family)